MKIALASDHAGFHLKKTLTHFLEKKKISVLDLGVTSFQSVDYPDYASKLAEAVSQGEAESGILVCGTGLGMVIVANKFKGIRAVSVYDSYSARMAKEHNNANVIALGARTQDPQKAKRLVEAWLEAHFQGNRHQDRVDKISQLEKKNFKGE